MRKETQLEAGNLYPVRIPRTVRAQKTRTKLKELSVNRLDIFTNFLNVALVCNFKLASIESADGDKEPRRVRDAIGGRMRAAPRYK